MSDVFVSHVENDAATAIEIATALESAGYATWYYEKDSVPGVEYLRQVSSALDECKAVLLLITEEALESNQVHNEVIYAYEERKSFIPVLDGITHAEFKTRQPVWRAALGASTSINVPAEGVGAIVPRIIAGLDALGIEPRLKPGRPPGDTASAPETPTPPRSPQDRPPTSPQATTTERSRWKLPATVLGVVAAVALLLAGGYYLTGRPETPDTSEAPAAVRETPAQLVQRARAALNSGDWAAADSAVARYVETSPDTAEVPAWREQLTAGRERALRSFDFARLRMVASSGATPAGTVVFTPDDRYLLTGTIGQDIIVRRRSDGQIVRKLIGHVRSESIRWEKGNRLRPIDVSSDGQHAVSGGADQTVRIWRLADGALLHTLYGHSGAVKDVAFTPDGHHVVSCSDDSTVRVWRSTDGAQVRVLRGHTSWVYSVAITPDGQSVVSAGGDSTVRVWDVSDGTLVRTLRGHKAWVTDLAITPDGRHLFSAGAGSRDAQWAWAPEDSSIKVWTLSDGLLQRTIPIGVSTWRDAIATTPDGRHVVAGCADGTVRVLAVADGRVVRTFGGPEFGGAYVALSSDGRHIARGGWKSLRLLNFLDGVVLWDSREVASASGAAHSFWVTHVAVTPDGRYVISSAFDGSIIMRSLPGGDLVRTISRGGPGVEGLALSADGRYIVTGRQDSTLRVLRTSDGGQWKQFEDGPQIWALALDAAGRYIASWGGIPGGNPGGIRLRRFSDGALLGTWGLGSFWLRAAFTPDGEHVVASSKDSMMSVWRVADGRLLRTFPLPNTTHCLAIRVTADGKYIVAGTVRGTSGAGVHLWRLHDCELLASGQHDDSVRGIALHPDGQHIASAGMDGTIKIWRLRENNRGGADLQPVRTLETERSTFSAVTFTPDGSRIIAGDMDGSLSIWGVP